MSRGARYARKQLKFPGISRGRSLLIFIPASAIDSPKRMKAAGFHTLHALLAIAQR